MKNSVTTLKKEKPYKRYYTNFDEENFRKDIEKLNLKENILKIKDLNKKYDTFHDNVMEVANKDVPLKKLSNNEIKRKKKPWITKGIITSIHKRNSHSGHPPPFLQGELSLQQNFQKRGGLYRTSPFRGGLLGKRRQLVSGEVAIFN